MFNAMKKIFSLAVVLCAVAMVSCGGNAGKKAAAADATATEAAATPSAACDACPEKCDSTAACCGECSAEKACCKEAAK